MISFFAQKLFQDLVIFTRANFLRQQSCTKLGYTIQLELSFLLLKQIYRLLVIQFQASLLGEFIQITNLTAKPKSNAYFYPSLSLHMIIISVDQQQFFYKAMKKEVEEWISWGKKNKRFIAFYKENVVDLTDFLRIHPGGRKSLENFIYRDVTDLLFKVYPHKKQTTETSLLRFTIGLIASYDQQKGKNRQDSKSIAKNDKSKKKVGFRNTVNYSMEQNKRGTKIKQEGQRQIKKGQPNIRNTINEGKTQKKHIRDKYQVSIKLIGEDHFEKNQVLEQKGKSPKEQKKLYSQLDVNIQKQDTQEQTNISRIPVLAARCLNKPQTL